MPLSLAIKVVIVFLFSFQLSAQNDSTTARSKISKVPMLFDDERQYIGSVALTYQEPMPYGNNFIGEGFEAKGGYNFNLQFYIFKNIFVGLSYGFSYFNTTNTALLGNYNESRIEERYAVIGYEFVPLPKVRLGINASLGGRATFSNSIPSGYGNRDTGKLNNLGLTLEYEFIKNLNILIAYNWLKIKTDIRVPNELVPFFEEGTYKTIQIGLKFNFGNEDLVDKLAF